MRKVEFLHLHALFAELRHHLEDTENVHVPPEAFTAYDEYDVSPTAIHRRKDRHHEALDRLRYGVRTTIEREEQIATHASTPARPVDANTPTR